jgi:hypothetical protein
MNHNVGVDYPGFIAWNGTQSIPVKVDGFNHFGFTFKTLEELAADTTFQIFYHEPSEADPCLPGPAIPVPAIAFCDSPATLIPGEASLVTLAAGTDPQSFCAGTVPCRAGAWISIAPIAAQAEADQVNIVVTMRGATR